MVRECRPREREPVRSWLARRSTMATSTPANASSPASISPVGPPPAITTAWSAILRSLPPIEACSARDAAPVHGKRGAGDERGFVRGEEQDRSRDLLGRSHAAERTIGCPLHVVAPRHPAASGVRLLHR